MKKAVVVFSGGMDSTTLLYKVKNEEWQPFAISFNYGQRHKTELTRAKDICRGLEINLRIVDLRTITPLLQGSALTSDSIEVPEGNYAGENMKTTVVPNRNAIMTTIAVGYAVSIEAERVFLGIHAGDHPIYPDCRPQFIEAFDVMSKIANEGYVSSNFRVMAPFVDISKDEIVKIGSKLNVPYEKTWSCYKGGEKHCGRCGTCVERKEAFQLAGVEDPTEYV